jgi:L-ascorbate metabolism protein UlaG (beta-lactamase superfamily)
VNPELNPQEIDAAFFERRAETAVAWLGMAGVVVNARGTILLIDPLITTVSSKGQRLCESGHSLKFPLPLQAVDVPRVDAVLYTHADGDHLGRWTAATLAARLGPTFFAPPPVGRALQGVGVSEERIVVARDFASTRVGQAEVVVTPALHDWQAERPWQRGDCCGYLIHTPDGTIWHPGDTRLIDELLDVRGVDVLFFDVAAVDAHLGPKGSARLAESCGAQALIAYHYGTFDLPPGTYGSCDPRDALPYVAGLSARYLQLNPGELLRLPLDPSPTSSGKR